MSEGLLTIAFGPAKYVRMAKALSRSYRRLDAKRPFAIVTDVDNSQELSKYFDVVIPINMSYGNGVIQKLHADLYSPFDDTLFIDSDCLFYKSPDLVWRIYADKNFSMRGWRYLTGSTEYEKTSPYEWVEDTADFLRKNGLKRLPHFNSGIFFFRKSDDAMAVFAKARDIYEQRENLGFVKFKNAPINDEPAFATAMELCGIEMRAWDNSSGMETAINMDDMYGINILSGRARFRKNGADCDPAVIHFNVDAQSSSTYNREIYRLEHESSWFRSARVEWLMLRRHAAALTLRAGRFVSRTPSRLRDKGIRGIMPNHITDHW